MAEPGGFDFDSITFDDDTDTNKEAKPTTEKPDVNMEDVKPQSQAAALLIASDIFNSDIFNTRANQQSPTHGTEERPVKRPRFSNIAKPRANSNIAGVASHRSSSMNSPAMSPDSVDEMVAANEQMAVHSKQRIIDQIRENQRMTAIYKKDREMVESIGDTLMEAMQLFSELKAETPVPYKQMVDMIEHLSLVFNFEPAR